MDCSSITAEWGNYGCKSGSRQGSMKYVIKNGITTGDKYPYTGVQGKCRNSIGEFKIRNMILIYDCPSLDQAILLNPILVSVNSTNWKNYASGVFDECDYSSYNHGVLLVGRTKDAYIVKNSWGADWADENGYIRLKLGNCCGICDRGINPVPY